jgi:uncharacterized membrane protein YjjP (DUF1212 family)
VQEKVASVDVQAVETVLRFARSAHEAGGYPASELEPRVVELARALGVPALQIAVTPTLVELTVGRFPEQQVYVLRVEPHPVDLNAIGRLDDIAAAVVDGRIDGRRAFAELEDLGRNPLRRPTWLVLAAYGVIGGALAIILGGRWNEAAAAALVGFAVGFVANVVLRGDRAAALRAPLGAAVGSFLAAAIARAGLPISVGTVTFAALVVLLPGMTMAIGMRELASRHLQAGVANSANALVQLVGLAFGVMVGMSLATVWLGPSQVPWPRPLPFSVVVVASAVVGLCFVVTLRAPSRYALWSCAAAVLAIVANFVANRLFGDVAGVLVAALAVGLAGNAVARHFRHSALAFVVPGLLMLVPGGIGYESAASLMAGRTVSGIDTAFQTIVVMLAIAYGLVASALIMPEQPAASRRLA